MEEACVRDVYEIINAFAPFDTQMGFDNSGLLAGNMSRAVSGILCALDLSMPVIEEALEIRANLIVTHHPILFKGRKNLRDDDTEGAMLCALIKHDISLIAAHTNYDIAVGGVNDVLAAKLGLINVTACEADEDGLLRIGDTEPLTLEDFTKKVSECLHDSVRAYGPRDKMIRRVALCGGSAGEYAEAALRAGADAYITGEMRYHDSIDLAQRGFATLHCGHDATEKPAVYALAERLKAAGVPVTVSERDILSATCITE